MRFRDILPFQQFLALTAARWTPYQCSECGNMIDKDSPHSFGCSVDPAKDGPSRTPRTVKRSSFRTYLLLYAVFILAIGGCWFLFVKWI